MSRRRKIAAVLQIEVAGKRYPVPSIEAASALVCRTRDKTGIGSRDFDAPHIFDGSDQLVGYVSYNGKVWEGRSKEWTPKTKMLFDPGRIM